MDPAEPTADTPPDRVVVLMALCALLAVVLAPAEAGPEGQMTWALHFSLAPTLFEPAETPGIVSPFMILYALHDALVKPMPGKCMAPSLAESWSVSPDGLVYEFVLRKGVRFHNGDPVTAEDAKFSFERYRGVSAKTLKDKVAAVETPDPGRVRFRLKQPWPDFMTFYATPATGATGSCRRSTSSASARRASRRRRSAPAPIGSSPPRRASSWCSRPSTATGARRRASSAWSSSRSPTPSTRLVMLKRGDTDVAYVLAGELGEEVQRTPGLTLRPTPFTSTHWLLFADQWDTARRGTTGACASPPRTRSTVRRSTRPRASGSPRSPGSIIPTSFDFYWQPPAIPYDPARAKQLLAEAGHPEGFRRRRFLVRHAGVRDRRGGAQLSARGRHPGEAAPDGARRDAGLVPRQEAEEPRLHASAASTATRRRGSRRSRPRRARTRTAPIRTSTGSSAIRRASWIRKKREALVHRIQQLMHDKVMFLPVWQLSTLTGYGPRVAESGPRPHRRLSLVGALRGREAQGEVR